MSAKPAVDHLKGPSLLRNFISFVGAAIVTACAVSIGLLVLIEITGAGDSPYVGIITYIVLPAIMVFGMLLIPIGMLWERRRRRGLAPGEIPAYPVLDFNDPRRRRMVVAFSGLTLVFVFASAFGSYRAYEYTESVGFCGTLCHSVMKPENDAFRVSAHARIRCVDCHVGPGADWYVRSKLSGAYQVYSVTFNKYSRPITTPVHNLRPAQETCEQCHWPEKFFGAQLKVFNNYAYDEANTPHQSRLLIKTGGGSATTGMAAGIHWHMNIGNKVTYGAVDPQRQVIPWVQLEDGQGNKTVYRDRTSTIPAAELDALPRRLIDCVECHNRPSHVYVPPDRAVNEAFVAGRLDPALPYLKREAVAALAGPYETTPEAVDRIGSRLTDFYRAQYPAVYAERRESVDNAIAEVRRIYTTYVFPEMKVDWQTHPDNIGHFYFKGCFRCHDGNHVSDTGKVIRNDCAICHTTLDQTDGPAVMREPNGEYVHPVDLGTLPIQECSTCHKGDRPFTHPLNLGDISRFQCSQCHPGGTGR